MSGSVWAIAIHGGAGPSYKKEKSKKKKKKMKTIKKQKNKIMRGN